MLKRLPLGRVLKVLAGSTALLALGLVSPPAEAAIPAVFTNTAAPIPCAVRGVAGCVTRRSPEIPGAPLVARSKPSTACRSTCA